MLMQGDEAKAEVLWVNHLFFLCRVLQWDKAEVGICPSVLVCWCPSDGQLGLKGQTCLSLHPSSGGGWSLTAKTNRRGRCCT